MDKQNQKHYVTEILGLNYNLLESRTTIASRENNSQAENMILEAEELPF